jgi:hypothetical protein
LQRESITYLFSPEALVWNHKCCTILDIAQSNSSCPHWCPHVFWSIWNLVRDYQQVKLMSQLHIDETEIHDALYVPALRLWSRALEIPLMHSRVLSCGPPSCYLKGNLTSFAKHLSLYFSRIQASHCFKKNWHFFYETMSAGLLFIVGMKNTWINIINWLPQ